MESKIKDNNYYLVQAFMVKELHLKGLEKELYAIIYGFSQAEEQVFTGSLQYLCDWTGATKQGIMKALNSLIDKGLLKKNEKYFNGVKFVEYSVTEFTGIKLSLTGGSKLSLPNNIYNNKIEYNNIVDYLNLKAKTNYRSTTPKTQSLIRARMKEGFTEEDFKKVIDNMCSKWLGTDMAQYLRPETLFGNKIEGYLNLKVVKGKQANKRDYTKEQLDNMFDDIENIQI